MPAIQHQIGNVTIGMRLKLSRQGAQSDQCFPENSFRFSYSHLARPSVKTKFVQAQRYLLSDIYHSFEFHSSCLRYGFGELNARESIKKRRYRSLINLRATWISTAERKLKWKIQRVQIQQPGCPLRTTALGNR